MTHVEPLLTDGNEDDHFAIHTNVRRFVFESAVVDDTVAKSAPQVARQGLRRVFLISMFFAFFLLLDGTIDVSMINKKSKLR